MIYSNLKGTTGNQFQIGADGNGQLMSNNAYDLNYGIVNKLTNISNPNVIAIKDGTDLNTIVNIGQYYCNTDDTSKTYQNCPTVIGFVLDVFASVGENINYKIQKIVNRIGEIYIRNIDFNIPGEWKKVATTNDIPIAPTISTVGQTGQYNDLLNKPVIESGTFTPTVSTGYTLNSNNCNYSIVGKLVYIEGLVNITVVDSSYELSLYIPRSIGAKLIGVTHAISYINNIKTAYDTLPNFTLTGFIWRISSGNEMDMLTLKAFLRGSDNKYYPSNSNSILKDGMVLPCYFNGSYIIQ